MELYLTGVHSEDNLWKQIEMLLRRVVKLEAQVLALQPGHEYRAFATALSDQLKKAGVE